MPRLPSVSDVNNTGPSSAGAAGKRTWDFQAVSGELMFRPFPTGDRTAWHPALSSNGAVASDKMRHHRPFRLDGELNDPAGVALA